MFRRYKESKYENELILSLAFNRTLTGFYQHRIVFGKVLCDSSLVKNQTEFYRMISNVIRLYQMINKYGKSISPELLNEWLNALQECKLCIDMLLFDYESIYQNFDRILV